MTPGTEFFNSLSHKRSFKPTKIARMQPLTGSTSQRGGK